MDMTVSMPEANRSSADSVEVYQPFMGMTPDEFRKLANTILIAVPCARNEGVSTPLFNTNWLWGNLGTHSATLDDTFGGYIELTRAATVSTFLRICKDKPELEYLVLMDADERVPWDAPFKLAQWGKDVVSGVVCSYGKDKGGIYVSIIVKDKQGIGRFPSVQRTKRIPLQGLKEIEGCGAGLVCIHKRVLVAMREAGEHPFEVPHETRRHAMDTGTLKQGEDMAFCERARNMGFKIYVDFSVRAGHFKTVEIEWPEENLEAALSCADWEISTDDFVHT